FALAGFIGPALRRRRPRKAVDGLANVFGTAPEYPRKRPADQDGHHAGTEGGRAPTPGLHRPGDDRDKHPAEGKAEGKHRKRPRTEFLEPVDDGDVDREE